MLILKISRQHAEFAKSHIFNYVNMLKRSQLNNIAGAGKTSSQYLQVKVIHCLLDDAEMHFTKKLLMCNSKQITIKFSIATGIAFYRMLLTLPVLENDYYLNHVRNNWIMILDQQIIKL